MISVIISSQNETVLQAVKKNIEQTIGVPFEIIAIENSRGQMGICEVYNTAASRAGFDIFCFMHEDISFETKHWGRIAAGHLQDSSVGLIGVAGGDTKGLVPSSWSSSVFQSEISIIQHYKKDNALPQRIVKTGYPEDPSTLKNVVCLDGVWLCTKREIFEKFRFDNNTFNGFHGYDIDYSLQVFSYYKVCVVFDILIHHYSDGSYSRQWMNSMIAVSKKWKKQLPRSVRKLSKDELIRQHWTSMGVFIEKLIALKYSFPDKMNLFCRYSFNRYFHLKHFLHFLRLLLFSQKH
jgi:hypothetical protein